MAGNGIDHWEYHSPREVAWPAPQLSINKVTEAPKQMIELEEVADTVELGEIVIVEVYTS